MNKKTLKQLEIAVIALLGIVSVAATIYGLVQPEPFWDWIWMRHANTLSWFVRPLFVPLLVYFAYRRNSVGVAISLVSVFTSMYWFAIPDVTDELVAEFLLAEQEYLLGQWTIGKILVSSLVPISLCALIIAFWNRSLKAGVLVVNLIAFAKVLWSVVYEDAGWSIVPFALVGLLITDALLYVGYRYLSNNKQD